MGSDYTARKAAKRKRKRHNDGAVDAEELDGTAVDDSASGHKRERRKRPKVPPPCHSCRH